MNNEYEPIRLADKPPVDLYHLTDENNLDNILKNGLIPQTGKMCSIIGDERKGIFLCEKADIPYWYIILQKPVILKVQIPCPSEENHYHYSHYGEYFCTEKIDPGKITVVSKNAASDIDTEKAMTELCISLLYTISFYCVTCARFYRNTLKETTEQDIYYSGISICAIIKNLDYSSLDMDEIKNILKSIGEEGEYTFCDCYDGGNDSNTDIKLWQKLIEYPDDSASEARRCIYDFIRNTFPFAETLCTGGMTWS